jgi:primosomal protein N' (replication factor Y) (superfamily II helicase)
VIPEVGSEPAVIVATPGAEPRAAGGYAAAVLLDGWALLGRASLRASEEALRRWLNAAALVRPAGPGGTGGTGGTGEWAGSGAGGGSVVVVAESTLPPVQALVRWDPVTQAERELAERRELRFPPAVRVAALTGPEDAVQDVIAAAELPAGAEVLGPVPVPDGRRDQQQDEAAGVRLLVRVDRRNGTVLACALRTAQATRTARKDSGVVRLQLDPAELL